MPLFFRCGGICALAGLCHFSLWLAGKTPKRAILHTLAFVFAQCSVLLVSVAALQPALEREARAAEQLRRLGEIAAGKLHCPVDIRALEGVHLALEVDALLRKVVHREAAACARTHSQQRVKASLLACEDALTAEKYAALHHVSQLAHVALPVVALQQSEEFWRNIL